MRTHGWSVARAALAVAIAGLGLAALVPAGAGATSTAPVLRVDMTRGGDVKVQWKFTTDERRDDVKLRIERKAPGETQFTELKTFSRPRARASYTDRDDISGVRSYRGILVVRGIAQAPGAVVSTAGPNVGTTSTTAPNTSTTQPNGSGSPQLQPGQSECPAGYVGDVLTLVNAKRREAGAAALKNNQQLAWAARQRSIDMAKSGNLTHTGWTDTIRRYGYSGGYLAENIAYGYGTPAAVVQGWVASAGHYGNMIGGYVDSGVGCVLDGRGRPWWTQDFGK